MSLKNPVTPPGIDPGTVRLVAQRLKHYATSGPNAKKDTSNGNFILSGVNVSFEVLTEHKIRDKIKMSLSVN
jgi:hypothetical protein